MNLVDLMRKELEKIPKEVKMACLAVASPFLLNAQDMRQVEIKSQNSKDLTYRVVKIGGVDYFIKPNSNDPCGFSWAYPGKDLSVKMDIHGNKYTEVNWRKGEKLPYEAMRVWGCEPQERELMNTTPKKCTPTTKEKFTKEIPYIGYLKFEEYGGKEMGYLFMEADEGEIRMLYYERNEGTKYILPKSDERWEYKVENKSGFCLVPSAN